MSPVDTDAFDPNDIAALQRRLAMLQTAQASHAASNLGAGAVAQADGNAVGQAGVQNQGSNFGDINTGSIGCTEIVNIYLAANPDVSNPDVVSQQIGAYLVWLRDSTKSITLRGIQAVGLSQVVVLPLETAYVPLRAKPQPRIGDDTSTSTSTRTNANTDTHDTDITLSQVLDQGQHLVIIGGPGSGKTTVLQHMAWALACSLITGQAEPAASRLGLHLARARLPLPFFVPLAAFARFRRNATATSPTSLSDFISQHLRGQQASYHLPANFFECLLANGHHLLLLLDGLDEVANESERGMVRQAVEHLVYGRSGLRVLVTCRTAAYRNGHRTALGGVFREIVVQPLDAQQHVAPMVRQAYACIYAGSAARGRQEADALLAGIDRLESERRSRLGRQAEPLASSPLMVRLLLIVSLSNRRLPDSRAELFGKAVDALLQVDYGLDDDTLGELCRDWQLLRDMAQHLAFYMHGQRVSQGKRTGGHDQDRADDGVGREIDEPALRAALQQVDNFAAHIDPLLIHARQRGSLIEERDSVYRFMHLAFQEYLVAWHLKEVLGTVHGRAGVLAFLGTRLADPWWREPTLLLAGLWAGGDAQTAQASMLLLGQAGTTPDSQFSAVELAATAALEWPNSSAGLRATCAERIVQLLADAAVRDATQPALRARAGDALARLGDPRFDATRLHLPADAKLGFVQIPADPTFCIGTRRADAARVAKIVGVKTLPDDELNDTATPCPAFHMAKFPVTVTQFRAYLQATGRAPGDADALRDPDSRPVRSVSWQEACDYASWLNTQLASAPQFDGHSVAKLVRQQGWRVALPNELEWEKAARGGRVGTVFPWGDTHSAGQANDARSGIGSTSAVGLFAANDFGLHDMVGNVWEWTRTPYVKTYTAGSLWDEVDASKSDAPVVVRGGSWDDHRDGARCACRFRDRPVFRSGDLGFRVVLRSAPVISPP